MYPAYRTLIHRCQHTCTHTLMRAASFLPVLEYADYKHLRQAPTVDAVLHLSPHTLTIEERNNATMMVRREKIKGETNGGDR